MAPHILFWYLLTVIRSPHPAHSANGMASHYREDILKDLVTATHEFYSVMMDLRQQLEKRIKRMADKQTPLIEINTPGLSLGSCARHHPIPASIPAVGTRPRTSAFKPFRTRQTKAKAALTHVQKLLNIKPPVTKDKLVRLMGTLDVPMEKYVAQRVDVLIRKYLTQKMKVFTEETCKRTFFASAPPFAPVDRVNVTWETELRGLMRVVMDSDGMLVRRPTEKLTTVIQYCSEVINGAYETLDDASPGKTAEEVFLERVKRYNGFAGVVNNISANMRFNASSLIFTYFFKANPTTPFTYIYDTLSNIQRGSVDVEEVLLKHLLGAVSGGDDDDDRAAKDPYNVVMLGGFAYEQIRPALRAEYALLKLLFFFSLENGRGLKGFVDDNYKRKYLQIKTAAFTINNVLQLFPGLMTVMFYMLTTSKDAQGAELLRALNYKFKVHTSVKGWAGRQESIETHKAISGLIERVAGRCIDLLATQTIKYQNIVQYINLLFMRSGLLRGGVSTAR